MITENESIIWASGHFLCSHFPEEFADWDEEQINQFMMENVWEPFEGYSIDTVWENIESLAYDFRVTINEKLQGSI